MSRFSLFRRNKSAEAAGTDLPAEEDGIAPEAAARQQPAFASGGEDPILPEKKKARRRLVGAVTITLAAIIVLPMIFESEPQTVSQDILIDIPSRDRPSQTVSREAARKKTEEKTVVASAEKEAARPAVSVAQEKKEPTPKPAETAAGSKPSADNGKEQPRQAATKPEPRVEKADARPARPETKAPVKQETRTATAKKADDPIGQIIAKQQAAPRPDKQAKTVIQVAAVSSPDKAKELQGKLKKAGLNSYTQRVPLKEGGERIRIRIGPLSSGKEVNQTCAKLSQLKLPCTLVN